MPYYPHASIHTHKYSILIQKDIIRDNVTLNCDVPSYFFMGPVSRHLLFISFQNDNSFPFFSFLFQMFAIMKMSKFLRASYEREEKEAESVDRLQAARWAKEDEVNLSQMTTFATVGLQDE